MSQRLSDEELQAIISREMPDHEIVSHRHVDRDDANRVVKGINLKSQMATKEPPPAMVEDAAASPEPPGAEDQTASLFKQFFGDDELPHKRSAADGVATVDADASGGSDEADDEGVTIVAVRKKGTPKTWDAAATRPKAVVISGKQKKIIGKQG